MKRIAIQLAAMLALGGAFAAGAAAAGSPPDTALGKKVYATHCRVCHGEKGDGNTFAANALDPRPRDFTSAVSRAELTRQRMIQSVTRGRKGTAMMPWRDNLSAAEIRAVIDYIRSGFMQLRD